MCAQQHNCRRTAQVDVQRSGDAAVCSTRLASDDQGGRLQHLGSSHGTCRALCLLLRRAYALSARAHSNSNTRHTFVLHWVSCAAKKGLCTCNVHQVRAAVRSLDRGGEPHDELHVLRVRSRKHEILIAPDYDRGQEYALVVVQDPAVE